MLKVLLIGGSGFVGKVFIQRLLQEDITLHVTKLPSETLAVEGVQIVDMDMTDPLATNAVMSSLQPDIIFHLAAISSVAFSWKNPALTLDTNILGALNIMEAVLHHCPKARLLLIGSSEEYGIVRPEQNPINEAFRLQPENPYAASKAAQDFMGHIYANAYKLDIIRIRAFNHIGPGQQAGFVIPDFCRQIALIESGEQAPIIRVGNLSAKRDYLDVRDVVDAYWQLSQKGISGKAYNVGSGQAYEIRSLLDMLLSLSNKEIRVKVDAEKIRPIDVPIVVADIAQLKTDTQWVPKHDIRDTLLDILNQWRAHE